MVGWRRSVRRFPQKWGGRREKKGRFERKSTIFHSISPDSQETKYFSHKIFGHAKLNYYFCAGRTTAPFLPPHCGVYIAQSRGTVPTIRRKHSLTYRIGATSPYPNLSEQTKRRYVPARSAFSRDRDVALSKLSNPLFMQYTIMFRCIALALTIHVLGHLSCRATVQHEDKEPQYLCRPWFSSIQHPRQVVPPPDGGQIVFAAYKCIVRPMSGSG